MLKHNYRQRCWHGLSFHFDGSVTFSKHAGLASKVIDVAPTDNSDTALPMFEESNYALSSRSKGYLIPLRTKAETDTRFQTIEHTSSRYL